MLNPQYNKTTQKTIKSLQEIVEQYKDEVKQLKEQLVVQSKMRAKVDKLNQYDLDFLECIVNAGVASWDNIELAFDEMKERGYE
jgi:hypothetical protein